jgi:glycosyltransferase involved in cell wall biosynthesis
MISIIICTYNSPELIDKCVRSIIKQKDIGEELEILLVDGGSNKKTINLLKNICNQKIKNISIRLINNPKRFPEGKGKGKWRGFEKSSGKIVGFIDQDNELVKLDTLSKIVKLMKKEKDCFGFAHRLFLDKKENWVNQTISLIGTDPVLAYRSLDYLSRVDKLKYEKKEGYKIINIPEEEIIVTGGNCFFYRRTDLKRIGGYIQDIDNIYYLNKLRKNKIILLDEPTTNHRAVGGFLEFLKKKKKWGKSYSNENREFSWMPKTREEKKNFIINFWKMFFIIPLILEKYLFALKYHEPRHLFTIPLYYSSLAIYSISAMENFLKLRR